MTIETQTLEEEQIREALHRMRAHKKQAAAYFRYLSGRGSYREPTTARMPTMAKAKKQTLKKFERTRGDKAADKKSGAKEGSKKELAADRKITRK